MLLASRAFNGKSLCIIALFLGLSLLIIVPAFGDETSDSSITPFPMNVLQDKGIITLYVNEDALVRDSFEWRADGSFISNYTLTVGGQSVTTKMDIKVDRNGLWNAISIESPQGPVEVVREGDSVKLTARGQTNTLALKSNTILFENFSPALMSQMVLTYDQKAGGKQTFPLFLIPAAIMDATIERLEAVERPFMGKDQKFTIYRYGLPGVDVELWVDENNRVCIGEVPAQHAAYVREGYETLRIKEQPDSLISQPKYEVVVESNVGVPMRDGIKLATDIYRPRADGQFPVILTRTPYKKELSDLQARYYARRGYVFAVQDCRGRFSSPGVWNPFFDEPKDGYDAIEWLAKQPWSNGKVGMIGASYVGWVQWWAARERPPHLVTIIPNVSPPDPYFNIPYEYGSFFLVGAIWWADVLESNATGDISGKAMTNISEKKYVKLLRHLPVIDLDSIVMGKRNPYWREWIMHPNNDDYWDRASFLKHLGNFNVPVYHQSGWYDGDGIGSKLNYLAMSGYGHQYQKLVLGPWGHSAEATRRGPNNTDFGPNAIVDMQKSYTRWLDRWLLGINNGIDKEPLVSLFVMGANRWLYGDKYPLPETKMTRFYLASKGKANSSNGDGQLTMVLPADSISMPDTYIYDPADPTPDPNFPFSPEDTLDESQVDSTRVRLLEEEIAKNRAYSRMVDSVRQDILVYDTPALEDSLTFAGPVSAVLYASSSAKDTDWFMRLSKINEDGSIYPLIHGVIRARFHKSFSKPEMLEPGKIYEFHLDMWQTGIMIPKGSKLRVEVCSASFPTFSRNLNTGGHNETETNYVSATQTIYHDKDHPSHILLPVIPNPNYGEASKK